MSTHQTVVKVATSGRGLIQITAEVVDFVRQSSVEIGMCNVFIHHTSASLIVNENYDADVLLDLEAFMCRLVVDGDTLFKHVAEGPDDMPSHIRSILTQTSVNIPVTNKKLVLGRWQGIFLWEHRFEPHERTITLTVLS